MSFGASSGLIEIDEADIVAVSLTSPDVTETNMNTRNWRVYFSSTKDYTTLVTQANLHSDGVSPNITLATTSVNFTLNPTTMGLTVPVDMSGAFPAYYDYYADVYMFSTDGAVKLTRGQFVLRVYRVVTR